MCVCVCVYTVRKAYDRSGRWSSFGQSGVYVRLSRPMLAAAKAGKLLCFARQDREKRKAVSIAKSIRDAGWLGRGLVVCSRAAVAGSSRCRVGCIAEHEQNTIKPARRRHRCSAAESLRVVRSRSWPHSFVTCSYVRQLKCAKLK